LGFWHTHEVGKELKPGVDIRPISPHQCGSVSAGIPITRAEIMPIHVPIWQKLPSAPLYAVGATCKREKTYQLYHQNPK
jgi:hypothetical protein